MKGKLSACLITHNEEKNIQKCLETLAWVDEIVLVDSHSSDRTVEIARSFTDKIVLQDWEGFVQQKNFATALCSCPWVLNLDADERVSPGLQEEILSLFERDEPSQDGFLIPRHTFYLGRWIDHGGWYPDHQLRLFRKAKARWTGEGLHERAIVQGRVGYLRGEILHYTYRDLSHQLRTIDLFSNITATQWWRRGRKVALLGMLFHPPIKFVETFFYKKGILDGVPGLIISIASSFYVFMKYAKLWEMRHVKAMSNGEFG